MYSYDLLPPIVPDSIPPSTIGEFTIPITVYGNITDDTIKTLAGLGIQTIQIAIVNQNNTEQSINSIEGKRVWYDKKTKTFNLKINSAMLPIDKKTGENQLYKVQLRWSNKTNNKNVKYFSEWSSVCLIRYIRPVTLDIVLGTIKLSQKYKQESTTNPNFIPDCFFSIKGKLFSETQILKNYQIILRRKNDTTKKYFEYLKTDFLSPDSATTFTYKIKESFMQGEKYQLIINASTLSGYKIEQQVYYFIVANGITDEPELFICQSEVNDAQSTIDIHIIGKNDLKKNLIICRASSEDNFFTWTNMAIVQFDGSQQQNIEVYLKSSDEEPSNNYQNYSYLVWSDKTIKSGIFYKYSVAILYKAKDKDIYITGNHKDAGKPKTCIFEDMYLINKDRTLRIKYNPEINNFKYNFSESVQTTLGSKYPFINRMGKSNYCSFQIGGLITSFMDSDQRSYVPPTLYHNNSSLIQTQPTKKFYLEQDKYNKLKTLFSNFIVGPDDNLDIVGETINDVGGIYYQSRDIDLLQSDGSIKTYTANPSDIVAYKNKNNYYLKYIFQDGRWKQIVNNISELKSFISSEQLFSKSTLEYRRTYNTQNNINQYNDIIYEREFREAVYNFLNDPSPKLFKSSQQGNFFVRLTNINFSPLKQLGRQLYSFNADAIEIDEYNINNLQKYNIYQIGTWKVLYKIKEKTYADTSQKTITNTGNNGYTELRKIYPPSNLLDNNTFLYYTHIYIFQIRPKIAILYQEENGTLRTGVIKEGAGLWIPSSENVDTQIQLANFYFYQSPLSNNESNIIYGVEYTYKYIDEQFQKTDSMPKQIFL